MKRPLLALAVATAVAGCAAPARDADYGYAPPYGNDADNAPYDNGGYDAQPPGDYPPDANAYYGPQDDAYSGSYDSPDPADVSFDGFYRALAPYGRWYHHPRWGDVWRPIDVDAGFRPYYRGHWEDTREFGWTWVSDYDWGDIPFHYGRWVYDPDDGWLWIPGYVWSPAWVVWRSGDGYVGWFPMPPDNGFLSGSSVYATRWDNWNSGFGYRDWYGPSFGADAALSFWVFVDERHFADRDFHPYVPQRNRYAQIVDRSVNITNYVTVNNYIVNRSVDTDRIARVSGRRIEPRPASQIFRRGAPVTRVNLGEQVDRRERRDHGGNPNASARERITVLTPPPRDSNPPRTFVPQRDAAPSRDGDLRRGERNGGAPAQDANPTTIENPQGRRDFNRRDNANGDNPRAARPDFAPRAPLVPPPSPPVTVSAPPPADDSAPARGFGQRGRAPQVETNANPPAAVPATQPVAPGRNGRNPRAVTERRGDKAQTAQPVDDKKTETTSAQSNATTDTAKPVEQDSTPRRRTNGRGARRDDSGN